MSRFEQKKSGLKPESERAKIQNPNSLQEGFAANILKLQKAIGNQAVASLLQSMTPIPREGRPLTDNLRADFETRFDADFSRVRVHTDGDAAHAARSMNAVAYTVGNDIVFDAGKFNPQSKTGQHLLAHELAHVVQQTRGGDAPSSFDSTSALEHGAARAATQFTAGAETVSVSGASSLGVARQEGLSSLSNPKGFKHMVTFKNFDEYVSSSAGLPYTVNDDGTVTAPVWLPYPPSELAPPQPAAPSPTPAARKTAPKPKTPEPPVDLDRLREIAEALQPRLIYPKPVRQFLGGLQFLGGSLEAGIGGLGGIATAETGVGLAAGGFLLLHGADVLSSGWTTMWTGEQSHTYTFRISRDLALAAGADPRLARAMGESGDLIATIGSAGLTLGMELPTPIALSPEAELDLELSQLARLDARPQFGVRFDLQWQDIASGVLKPEGYVLNPELQDLESLLNESGRFSGRHFNGKFMYVVDEQGAIRIGTRANARMPHPTLIGGSDPTVRAAGMVEIRRGQIFSVDNVSGHFAPSPESLGAMYGAFSRLPDTAFKPNFLGFRVFYFY